jgi:hypothetical protein
MSLSWRNSVRTVFSEYLYTPLDTLEEPALGDLNSNEQD